MKVVLASTSAVKIAACNTVFADVANYELITVKAPSNVNEQPLNDETLRGAFNRIAFAKEAAPDADFYVAIENGLFEENGQFVDRAVVVIENRDSQRQIGISDGVAFPANCVYEAMERGLDKWTVGKIMEAWGVVAKHDDPHLTLAGRSRAEYIDDALRAAQADFVL